jgi:predicted RNase H-like HicB family nuclease
MTNNRTTGFWLGNTEDGRFVAASVSNPIFCFTADTEKEASEKARRAIHFYFSDEGARFDAPVSRTKQVIGFVPQRRVEVECETA